jgi:membrane protease YdiL (CAAX protease family)
MLSKKAIVFLVLAYGLAWPLGFCFLALGDGPDSSAFVAIAVIYMFTPAAAAVIAQKLIWKEPLPDLDLRKPQLPWLIIAWLLPVLLALVAFALSLAVPGVSLLTGLDSLIGALATRLPPQQVAALHGQLEHTFLAKPGVLLFVAMLQVLGMGPTINAVAAFGEELGWRGLLLRELESLGLWRSSLVIGFFWGLWHLPLIVAGYNYPGHLVAGPIMMIVLTMLLSPLIGFVCLRAQSVFAAAVFHGTFNAAATLVVFIHGGNAFSVGFTGAAGLVTLLLADVALWLYLRRRGTDKNVR